MILRSFKPIANQHSRILILGSMPGPEALRKRQYYGYPHNAFWKIMADLFLEKLGSRELGYPQKITLLLENRIALWDVIGSCTRKGASDASIQNILPNDLEKLFRRSRMIETVFLNGKLAYRLYEKYFSKRMHVPYYGLPSTSPAHASMSYAQKLKAWSAIKPFLRNRNPWC